MSAAPELRAALEQGLAGRYTIERELGQGGMAVVFLAHDVKHDRRVALKVLLPEIATAIGAERFLREIKVTANLQHPNILPLFDSGEVASYLYYVMPFVEGESLHARLKREKQLPIEDALHIATVVANALDYAHRHGVVHRDLKPDNILMHEGEPVVADFGIALALSEAGAERLTVTGISLGTPHYMSPEQATGDRAVDARSDIYALGAVTYEMLTGEPPHLGNTAQAIISRILTEEARSVRATRGTVSVQVDAAVKRALEKTPADRWASAHDFAAALSKSTTSTAPRVGRRTRIGVMIAATVLVVAGAGALISRYVSAHASAGARTRIAVLPFENTGSPAEDYFVDGLTDAIRGKLSELPPLEVIAKESSKGYKNTTKRLRDIGKELGAQFLLTGTIRFEKVGGETRIQVNPQLVDVSVESAKWQHPFEGVLTEVFKVQGEIAGEVASALNVALGVSERQQLGTRPTHNLAAYEEFLKGDRASDWPSNAGSVALTLAAIPHYAKAVELDPAFGEAWSRLSMQYTSLFVRRPEAVFSDSALRAGQRAVDLKPDGADGHIAVAFYHRYITHDNEKALAEFAKIHDLAAANNELLFRVKGAAEASLGRWDAGLSDLRQVQSLSPRSPGAARILTRWLAWLRHDSAAVAMADVTISLDSTIEEPRNIKMMLQLSRGDVTAARRTYDVAEHQVDTVNRGRLASQVSSLNFQWSLDDAQRARWFARARRAGSGTEPAKDQFAEFFWWHGEHERARVFADSAQVALESRAPLTPAFAAANSRRGLMLAMLGRKREAVDAGLQGVALIPITSDAYGSVFQEYRLAQIYIIVGEPDKALDHIEPLLKLPGFLTPAWLRIDPAFVSLKGNSRFERLAAGK